MMAGDFGLRRTEFEPLGAFAGAALEATRLALHRAARSSAEGRIPIAAAIMTRQSHGPPRVISVGHNGRIPPAHGDGRDPPPGRDSRDRSMWPTGAGYPTDHGETAAVRAVEDFAAVDWSSAVFATTLSPCIMCTRTLEHLHGLGLRRLVVAESRSFSGGAGRLEALPGMQVLRLENQDAVDRMTRFATRYPWDWAADIGEIPPCPSSKGADLAAADLLESLACAGGAGRPGAPVDTGGLAGVFDIEGRLIARSPDQRSAHGGNPTRAAVIQAMGRAGSAVNLRDCVIALRLEEEGGRERVGLADVGLASLGACELFRPRAIVCNRPLDDGLAAACRSAGMGLSPSGSLPPL